MEVSPVGLLKNYGCAFEEFKHKVEGMKNEEILSGKMTCWIGGLLLRI